MPCLPPSFSMSVFTDHRGSRNDTRRRYSFPSLSKEEPSHGSKTFHGRGARNTAVSSALNLVTIETPTLKGDMRTTGRMARNDNLRTSRRAQDLTGYPLYQCTPIPRVGRGGAPNAFKSSKQAVLKANRDRLKREMAAAAEKDELMNEQKNPRGLANVGRDWLFRSTSVHVKDLQRRGRRSAREDVNLTILFDEEKKSIGLADRGKEWIFDTVSDLVSGRK